MPPISHPFLSTKNTNPAIMLKSQFSISCWQILIYAIPNADYQKIDLKPPQTKHNKYNFEAKKAELFK